MPDAFGSFGGLPCVITTVGSYKPGDPCPEGYTDRAEWARVQMRAGLRQRRCKGCGLFLFQQELADHKCERKTNECE